MKMLFRALAGLAMLCAVLVAGVMYAPSPVIAQAVGFFQQLGVGAVARTFIAKLRENLTVGDFGATPALADNAAFFQAANDAVSAAGGGNVYLTAGTYTSCSVVHISANVTFAGLSQTGATIVPCVNNQVVFDKINSVAPTFPDNIGLSNLTIDALSFTGVTGIKTVLAVGVTVSNVVFAATANNVEFDRGRYFNILNSMSRGNAGQAGGQLKIWSSSDANYVAHVTVDNYKINNTGNGIQTAQGIYLRRVLASTFSQVNMNDGNGKIGILLENDSQGNRIANSIFAACSSCITIQAGSGVVQSPSFTTISNVDSDQSTALGINLIDAQRTTISGGKITSSGVATTSTAVSVGANTRFTTIENITIDAYSGAGGTAIALGASVDAVLIANNRVINTATGISFAGTPTNVLVIGNDLNGATTKTSGTISGSGNAFWNNLGLPNYGSLTATLGVAGTTFSAINTAQDALSLFQTTGAGKASRVNIDSTSGGFNSIWSSQSAVPNWRIGGNAGTADTFDIYTGSGDTLRARFNATSSDFKQPVALNTKIVFNTTAPTISSGFCTSPSISNSNGTAAFTVTIGSACAASTGVLTMPAASVGWACYFANMTNPASNTPYQTASTTTSVSLTNYVRTTGVAGNWTASDVIVGQCAAY